VPAAPRLELDPEQVGPDKTYSWLTQVVVPRPIAWVSTTSAAGVDNVAPHSFFTVSSQHPPVVQFTSVGRKDSLRNIEETGEFVVNVVTQPLAMVANETATDYPRELDEFDEVGVEREPSALVRPPRVAQSPVSLECVAVGFHPFATGRRASTVVFGRVVRIAVSESVLTDGRVDVRLLRPVARLGGPNWATLGDVLTIHRKKYEAPPA
jgi:flavin reductase (DIM6/NTAB) family NADH-FMN oxidoreductase RutF